MLKGNIPKGKSEEPLPGDAFELKRPKVHRPTPTPPAPGTSKPRGRHKSGAMPHKPSRPPHGSQAASRRRPLQKGPGSFAGSASLLPYLRWFVLLLIIASAVILWQRAFQRRDLKQPAPHFQTQTVNGQPISLSDFVGQKKLVLVFYRGSFSGTSTDRLKALQESYPKIRELGAEVIAVSTESRNTALRTAMDLRLTYPLVSDIRITELYGTYNPGTLLSQPAVFIVDREGIIRWRHIGRGPLDFPAFSKILSELEKP